MRKLGGAKAASAISMSRWAKGKASAADLMTGEPLTCSPSDTVSDVLPLIAEKFRRLPVVDSGGALKGIVASTDILKVLVGWGRFRRTGADKRASVKVRDAMSPHVICIDRNADIRAVLQAFKEHGRGAYPVTHRKRLAGILTEHDIVSLILGETGVRVHGIMVRKPIVAQEAYSISALAKMFAMGGFRRLPVIGNGKLAGIVTARDVLGYVSANGLLGSVERIRVPVGDIMKRDMFAAAPNEDVFAAVRVMVSERVGGLPVLEGGRLAGIVTERDVVGAMDY